MINLSFICFNQSYGCLPFFGTINNIDFKIDLTKYKLCEYQARIYKEEDFENFYKIFSKNNKPECKIFYYDIKTHSRRLNSSTVINLIIKHNNGYMI